MTSHSDLPFAYKEYLKNESQPLENLTPDNKRLVYRSYKSLTSTSPKHHSNTYMSNYEVLNLLIVSILLYMIISLSFLPQGITVNTPSEDRMRTTNKRGTVSPKHMKKPRYLLSLLSSVSQLLVYQRY